MASSFLSRSPHYIAEAASPSHRQDWGSGLPGLAGYSGDPRNTLVSSSSARRFVGLRGAAADGLDALSAPVKSRAALAGVRRAGMRSSRSAAIGAGAALSLKSNCAGALKSICCGGLALVSARPAGTGGGPPGGPMPLGETTAASN
jgi:hypothetical protein